jgi:hypothetical protein
MSVRAFILPVLSCVWVECLWLVHSPSKKSNRLCIRLINWKSRPRSNKRAVEPLIIITITCLRFLFSLTGYHGNIFTISFRYFIPDFKNAVWNCHKLLLTFLPRKRKQRKMKNIQKREKQIRYDILSSKKEVSLPHLIQSRETQNIFVCQYIKTIAKLCLRRGTQAEKHCPLISTFLLSVPRTSLRSYLPSAALQATWYSACLRIPLLLSIVVPITCPYFNVQKLHIFLQGEFMGLIRFCE